MYKKQTNVCYFLKKKYKKNQTTAPFCFLTLLLKMLQTAQVSTISNPLSTEYTTTMTPLLTID